MIWYSPPLSTSPLPQLTLQSNAPIYIYMVWHSLPLSTLPLPQLTLQSNAPLYIYIWYDTPCHKVLRHCHNLHLMHRLCVCRPLTRQISSHVTPWYSILSPTLRLTGAKTTFPDLFPSLMNSYRHRECRHEGTEHQLITQTFLLMQPGDKWADMLSPLAKVQRSPEYLWNCMSCYSPSVVSVKLT